MTDRVVETIVKDDGTVLTLTVTKMPLLMPRLVAFYAWYRLRGGQA